MANCVNSYLMKWMFSSKLIPIVKNPEKLNVINHIESIKTTSMKDVSTGVLEKI